jgi:hypothetical protein
MSATANNPVDQPRSGETLNQRFLVYLDHAFPLSACRRRERFAFVWLVFAAALVVAGGVLGAGFWPAWLLLPLGLALGMYGAHAIRRARRQRRRCERQREVVRHGEPVTAYVVRASRQLLQPGTEPLPATVLFTFQPEIAADSAYLRYLARRVAQMHGTCPADADGRYVAALTGEEEIVEYRRRLLPLSFTDGSTVYCGDLWVKRSYLATGYLTNDTLPCLAERGDAGGIELVPAWLLDEKPAAAFPSSSPSAAAGPAIE